MKNKIFLTMFLMLIASSSFAASSNKRFIVEKENFDKYSNITSTRTKGNWVKSNQGKEVAFDLTFAKEQSSETDHYLVIKVNNDELFSMAKYFSIGNNLILTLNGSEKIHLKPSCISSSGKNTSISNGTGEDTIYLTQELYNRIIQANSIYFELQGSQYSNLRELTGSFKEQNLKNLRALCQ